MNNTTANANNGTFTSDPFPPAPSKSFWLGLLWPTLYLTILIGSLYTFSTTYRRRQQAKKARLAPLLPPHRQRDIYLSLLHLEPSSAGGEEKEKTLKKVPDSILKAALLQRALEDIKRIVQLRSAKPALQTLLQRGSVGDELWQRFLSAEQEMEAEVKDVVNEANAFAPGWGQVIFQSANEMNQNRLVRERIAEIQGQLGQEKEWWEKRRAGIQSELMKELEEEEGSGTKSTAEPKNRGSSDDDTMVLVDSGGPAQAQGGGMGSMRKKGRGKK